MSGWGTWLVQGHLALRRTQFRAAQSSTRQALSGKKEKNIPLGVLSLSLHALALRAPPHTWRCPLPGGCGVLMEAPWQGVRELLGQVF